MRYLRYLLLLIAPLQAYGAATTYRVPSRIKFADIHLRITRGAKARIQEKLDSLTRSKKHHQALVHRFNLFAPIVERILKEEGIPNDFKYLVLQESRLIADLVSSANAVGFWQFKEPAALEVGLNINQYVDERMHIAAATRAAARYLKKHYACFHNWLYALLAYYEGRGGAKKYVDKRYFKAQSMPIAPDAHFYIIHFLAHKIAFRAALGHERHPLLHLYEYNEAQGKSLHEISQEFGVEGHKIKAYNKWLKHAHVPKTASYPIIIPLTHQQYAQHRHKLNVTTHFQDKRLNYAQYWETAAQFPHITYKKHKKTEAEVMMVNHLPGIQAHQGDTLQALAQAGNLALAQFIAYNDLDEEHQPIPGQVYYYRAKHRRAHIHFHIAREGETWWSVAQKYGMRKSTLLSNNRLRKEVPLKPGRVMWLRFIRPVKIPVVYEYQS